MRAGNKMRLASRYAAILSLCLGFTALPAHAARPLNTDDARLIDAGGCQIETFVKKQRNAGEHETWFLPGCNPGGNLELTFGGMNVRNDAEGRASTLIAQGKTLLKPLEANGHGLAFALGATRQRPFAADPAPHWSPFVNLISSISLQSDAAVIHVNAGALEDRNAGVLRPTWGLGGELALAPRTQAIVETYGQKGEKSSQQIGIRYWAVPDRLQIDGTLGSQRAGTPARTWLSLGLRLLF